MSAENLWLFTDGGAFNKEEDEEGDFRAVSSFRFFNKNKDLLHKDAIITETGTTPFSEIKAICEGLTWAHEYLKELGHPNVNVLLFTDSMLCYMSLTQWIYGWIKKAKDGVFYGSKGTKVANQEEIKYAFNKMKQIRDLDCRVILFHINSHTSKKNLKKLHEKFQKFNNVKIPYDEFLFVYLQNEQCDIMIKKKYDQFLADRKEKEDKQIISEINKLIHNEEELENDRAN